MIQRFKTSMMLLGIAASAFAKGAEQKPNVLFIMIDDYGWADVGYNGSKFYKLLILIVLHLKGWSLLMVMLQHL